MSGRSVTITIGTTGSIHTTSSPEAAPSNGVKLAGEQSKDKMYEPKHSKKMVRVLTVIAYMFTVSLAAIMLSIYYLFLWSPRYAHKLVNPSTMASTTTTTTTTLVEAAATGVTATTSSKTLEDMVEAATCICPTLGNEPSVIQDSAGVENIYDGQMQLDDYQLQMDLADRSSSERLQFGKQHDTRVANHMDISLGDT